MRSVGMRAATEGPVQLLLSAHHLKTEFAPLSAISFRPLKHVSQRSFVVEAKLPEFRQTDALRRASKCFQQSRFVLLDVRFPNDTERAYIFCNAFGLDRLRN